MNAGSILEVVPYAVISALNSDLNGLIRPERKVMEQTIPAQEIRPYEEQCDIYVFPQSWGSTALGFEGVGGAAITSAYTTVVIGPHSDACVYFARRLAYHIQRPNQDFYDDLQKRKMRHARCADEYELDNTAA